MEDTRSIDRFAQRLKTLRKERGITQQQLADGVGISKGGLSYYENSGRTPDISILERFADYFGVTTDYLLGRTNAQTQKAKLQAVCNYTGLSDKSVELLADLKETSPAQLRVINFLLEQASGDMDIVYELDDDTDNYYGSILNAVVRYLSRYAAYDDYLAEYISSSDEGISSAIQNALHQLVLNQAITALKNGVDAMIKVLYEDTKE
ncbi:MAG: helix-turn-helix domain-containing protein [Lachnospiraceae bacterium]|nr:helix-turn-helix domain-containing protein [Lachnospiraceae bacterium]